MSEIWQQLQAEHDRIWDMLNVLTADTAQLPDAGNDAALQRRTALDLVRFWSGHEMTELTIIQPMVRQRCPNGLMLARESDEHEHKIRLALHELAHMRPPAPHFTVSVHTLASLARTHLSYEQSRIWPLLAESISATEAEQLARTWIAARAVAPTRPHPHLPMDGRATGLVAGALAPLDRFRDRLAIRRPA